MARFILSGIIAFLGGFVIMALEIIGARFLARDFGSTFYIWVSQIGTVMIALGVGYFTGGWIADRTQKVSILGIFIIFAGILTAFIPEYATPIIRYIVERHPLDQPVAELWQRLDPVIGSVSIFFIPCTVLAMISPFMIKKLSLDVSVVGRVSGFIIAISTLGSIFGVFVSGFLLIDIMRISSIFKLMGVLMLSIGIICQIKALK